VTQDDREALARVVLDHFHAPDDRHSSWWINTDEMVDAILAARPSVPTVTAEQVRQAARAADGAEWGSLPWVHTFLAALGIEVQSACPATRNRYEHAGPLDWSDLRQVVGTCKACGREVRQP
jgi:hypothetical protein